MSGFDLSTAKPVEGGGFDLKSAKPVAATAATASAAPAEQPGYGEKFLQSIDPRGAVEAVAELASGAVAKPVADVAGLAAIPLHAAGAIKKDPATVKQDIIEGGTYQPRTEAGKRQAEYNPVALVGKLLQFGGKLARGVVDPAHNEGGVRAGAGQAVEELVNQVPALFGARGSAKKAPAAEPKPVGAGAEPVVNEMQRQRTAGDAPVRGEVGMSARETAKLELDEATKPMRKAAFAMPNKVNMAEPLSLIERMKSQTNEPNVIRALDQAKAIIEDGIEKSKPTAPASGRMSAAEFKAMNEQGAQGTMPVRMLDETRQSINNIMNGVGQGEKAYGPFAKKELLAVQEAMLKYAPNEYAQYLTEYAKRAQGLEPFKAAGGVMEKVTTDPAAFASLNAADKQNLLKKAFESDTPGRTLAELVRDTAHNPQAAKGVREAYTDWLTQADPLSGKPTARGLTARWQETREAVKTSKLMTDEHIAAMDKVMDDVRSHAGSKLATAWASTGGFLLGQSVGHPIVGAHLARDIAMSSGKQGANKALEKVVMQIGSTPKGAAALAAPPTAANVARVREMMPKDVAIMLGTPAAQQEQQRPMRAKRLMSMQPAGL